jgi:ornithine cyclodeaminase/alanine dehydrogenase-like protein (mu-crystallin family)
MQQSLLISEDQVNAHLNHQELLDTVETALIDLSAGAVIQPLRSIISIPEQRAWFGLMPAVYRDVIGAKLVTVFPGNVTKGLESHQAVIQLFDRETGKPLASMGGRTITAWRTAAASALATRELARPDARILAILGSGVQAKTHAALLRLVRNFEQIRVWSRTQANAARFAAEVGGEVMSAEEAVNGADVIVTVTHSSEPVVRGEWIAEGALVNAVGAVGLHARELDDSAMRQSAVIVESREAAVNESGDIVHSGMPIYAELGEILSHRKPKPRTRHTIYKSLGVAVEDLAVARLIYRKILPSQPAQV